jgi:hypothetical protein
MQFPACFSLGRKDMARELDGRAGNRAKLQATGALLVQLDARIGERRKTLP